MVRLELHGSIWVPHFWECAIEWRTVTVCSGRIEGAVQTHTVKAVSPNAAEDLYRSWIQKKLAEGYKPTPETVRALLDSIPPFETPAAIESCFFGENVSEAVLQDVCGWLTLCMHSGVTPSKFRQVWDILLDGEDPILLDALTHTGEELWFPSGKEHIGLPEVHARAVEEEGDRFVWFDYHGDSYIVALRGDPGAQAIASNVNGEEDSDDDSTDIQTACWPENGKVGTPIASCGMTVSPRWWFKLRDGQYFEGRDER